MFRVFCRYNLNFFIIQIQIAKIRNLEFVQVTRVKVEFVKTGYKNHKIIRLYAKVELWEVVVQIEGNLRAKVQ